MNDTMTNMTMDANATEPAGDEVEDEPVEEEEEPVSVDIEFPDSPEGAPDVANTLGRRVLLQFEDAPMMNDTVPMMNDTMTNMTMDANATEPAGDEVEDEPVEEEEEPVSVDIEFPDSPEGAPDVANTLGRRVLLQFEDAPMMNDTVPMMN